MPHRLILLLVLTLALPAAAQVCNLKVVTDASPDYSDLPSMIRSITGKWETPADKVWAVFYWNHIARRQTAPMVVHGLACTDPIRQFNDYGYTMCSTIAGTSCSIFDAMGLPTRYWDISLHTVPEVQYDGRWHMIDDSMSALYTLCDGKALAGVEDIGKEGACEASGGKVERGHIAKHHCLYATGPNGFLTGADTQRALQDEANCFNPNGLKLRTYYYDWDRGHRYILNLRDGESYTRHYQSQGASAEYYVPNDGKDPDAANPRYRIRGNGLRTFRPTLTAAGLRTTAQGLRNARAVEPDGVEPSRPGEPGEVVFKVEGANVITSLAIDAAFTRRTPDDAAAIAVSTTNGLTWKAVWQADKTGEVAAKLKLIDEVNGAYEVLVRVTLTAKTAGADARLRDITFTTTTMLNAKTQPRLLLGRNTVYVGAGDQTESVVVWPDLQGDRYKPYVVEERNIATVAQHPGYKGTMFAQTGGEDAYVVFRVDAPDDITRLNYGGRFHNRSPNSHIDLLHSFDGGRTWTRSYSLTDTNQPWDTLHFETVDKVPAGTRSVLFKVLMRSPDAGSDPCSIYSVRMEVNHKAPPSMTRPIEVTFNWSERQADYSLVERSHTEFVTKLPHRYTINVGGVDHPVVNWLRTNVQGAAPKAVPGYSDGKDVGGTKWRYDWVTCGRVLSVGKPYTVSVPTSTNWGAGDPDGRKLTDGIVGPPYAGGSSPVSALLWNTGQTPDITVDLGKPESCGAFGIQLSAGWPWWDALKGEVKDQVEVLTSLDGQQYQSQGFFKLNLWWVDIPINHMMPDDESATGYNYDLPLAKSVPARYVRFHLTAARMVTVSEVQVFDFIKHEPFDIRIALPDEAAPFYRSATASR